MTTLDESALSESATKATEPPNPSAIEPGWYDDPEQLHNKRFYDGSTWTKHVTHFGPKPCSRCAKG